MAKDKTEINHQPKIIRAGGGIIWRNSNNAPEILIVHRKKYDDWSLPKGKQKRNETLLETALRETQEESGYKVSAIRFAGTVSYEYDGITKIVLYWHMSTHEPSKFTPNEEIDAIQWVILDTINNYLTYPVEKGFIKAISKPLPSLQ